ncbi:MAG: hypothetical protein M1401_20495 [Chloroflexi bacterium]|nr:hypothetical protein [Chloroflexota bacterium]
MGATRRQTAAAGDFAAKPLGAGAYGGGDRSPAAWQRVGELIIPPRPGPRQAPRHSVAETDEGQAVYVEFPVAVRPDEIVWRLNEDVLEIEYLGRLFPYYHAFLVPANVEPRVENAGRSLTFLFPRPTCG